MNKLIVADESVDYAIIQMLRDAGFALLAIVEEFQGWPKPSTHGFSAAWITLQRFPVKRSMHKP